MFLGRFGLESIRGLPFCEELGMVCVPLCEGSFSEKAKSALPPLLTEPGVECTDDFLEGQSWKEPQRTPVSPNRVQQRLRPREGQKGTASAWH